MLMYLAHVLDVGSFNGQVTGGCSFFKFKPLQKCTDLSKTMPQIFKKNSNRKIEIDIEI